MLTVEEVYHRYGFNRIPSFWLFKGKGSSMKNTLENFKKVYPTVYKLGFLENLDPTTSAKRVTKSWRRWAGYSIEVELFTSCESVTAKVLSKLAKIGEVLRLRRFRKWYATGKFVQIVMYGTSNVGIRGSLVEAELRAVLLVPWHVEPHEVCWYVNCNEFVDAISNVLGIGFAPEDTGVAELETPEECDRYYIKYHVSPYIIVPYGTTCVWYDKVLIFYTDATKGGYSMFVWKMPYLGEWWGEAFEDLSRED